MFRFSMWYFSITTGCLLALALPAVVIAEPGSSGTNSKTVADLRAEIVQLQAQLELRTTERVSFSDIPFYSQFNDISDPAWQTVGCGIASVAMIIDHYSDEVVHVDSLLATGRARGAFLANAGWTHAGLIGLANDFGLTGESISLAHLATDQALNELETVTKDGPVMASVHYTFEPTNPIPHLVVITGIDDSMVYYQDPAEPTGGGAIARTKFSAAWKQRYITIRPISVT